MTRRRAKVLAVVGAVLTASIAALCAAQLWTSLVWFGNVGQAAVMLGAQRGAVSVSRASNMTWAPASTGFVRSRAAPLKHWTWLPEWSWDTAATGSPMVSVTVPLWIPLLGAAAPTLLFARAARRKRAGACQSCGYDLSGSSSGVCPECGKGRVA